MTDFFERSLIVHEQLRGKIGVVGKMPIANRDDLSLAYTPGVARPCEVISRDPGRARDLTIKRNSVAVVTDGSAVLGLGNIGTYAAIPVMEGKALLFKEFANIDAWPICLDTQDVDEIVATVRRIAPVFGGINLEDISAPRCFAIEQQLQDIGIPVFHDDQHGTAIVLLAALLNAAKVLNRDITKLRVVINGAARPVRQLHDSCVVLVTARMLASQSMTLWYATPRGRFTTDATIWRSTNVNYC